MVQSIVLNSSNVVSGSNNTRYRFNLAQTTFFKKHSKIAIQSITIPYSWYNISANFNNNIFSVTTPCSVAGGSTKIVSLTIPDGFYTLTQLNSYLQSILILNGYYLVSGSSNVYFAQFIYNTSAYKIEIDLFPIPTTLGTTYTYGTTAIGWGATNGFGYGLPATSYTHQITFPATGGVNSILGFASNITLPSTQVTSTQSFLSTTTPNLTPINSLIVLSNLVNNKYSVNNQTLFGFTPNVNFGANIVINNSLTDSFVDVFEGYYSYIDLEFRDQNFNTMFIRDPNVCIILLLKDSDEK